MNPGGTSGTHTLTLGGQRYLSLIGCFWYLERDWGRRTFKTFTSRLDRELEKVIWGANLQCQEVLSSQRSPCSEGGRGELEAAPPTAAEIWQQHKHWCDFTSKVDFQWATVAKRSQKSWQKKTAGCSVEKKTNKCHTFRSGEFCFSTQGHGESNVRSYGCFYILNYGRITNVPPLCWM